MKAILLLLIIPSAFANFKPKDKIEESSPVYTTRAKCELITGKDCLPLPPNYSHKTHKVNTILVEGIPTLVTLEDALKKAEYEDEKAAKEAEKQAKKNKIKNVKNLSKSQKEELLEKLLLKYLLDNNIDPDEL